MSPLEELKSNQAQGDKIIKSIEQYQSKYGTVPARLGELSPEFIAEIPHMVSGKEFVYYPKNEFEKNVWTLTFYVDSNDTGCTYLSDYKFWDCWPPHAGDQ